MKGKEFDYCAYSIASVDRKHHLHSYHKTRKRAAPALIAGYRLHRRLLDTLICDTHHKGLPPSKTRLQARNCDLSRFVRSLTTSTRRCPVVIARTRDAYQRYRRDQPQFFRKHGLRLLPPPRGRRNAAPPLTHPPAFVPRRRISINQAD